VSNDGPGGCAGCGVAILLNPGSNDTFEMRSVAISVESGLFSKPKEAEATPDPDDPSLEPEPYDPGLEVASPSILLIPNANLSSIGLLPNDDEGDGSGWEPVIKTDSERGVWLPPRPLEGGTPMSRVP